MRRRLQPRVAEAATLCNGGCNLMWWRLQPEVEVAAMSLPCHRLQVEQVGREVGTVPRREGLHVLVAAA